MFLLASDKISKGIVFHIDYQVDRIYLKHMNAAYDSSLKRVWLANRVVIKFANQ